MKTVTVSPFYIIGKAIRTTNEDNRSATDIPQLWNEFLADNIAAVIPGKLDNSLYCVYTDYEKDHTRPYTTILGCRVAAITDIPEGLVGKPVGEEQYTVFTATGKITEGIVFREWVKIWNSPLNRTFIADFEVYDERAQNPDEAQVDIYIGIK